MARKGFYIDTTRCVNCKTCQVACKKKFKLPKGLLYRAVNSYEVGEYPNGRLYSVSHACNHCEDPACVRNCPTKAMYKDEQDGTVQHDDDRCIGCRACIMACPYGAPVFLEEKGIVNKCNACIDTREEDGATTCEAACGMRAIEFGDYEELRAKHPDAVQSIPCFPDPHITDPSILIGAREYAQDKNFKDLVM